MIRNVANNVAQGKVQDNVKKSHITTEKEPKSEKTTQDVQKNCLSLTELWKKGELEINNNYYLRFADGTEEIQLYIGGFLMRADNEVEEVLAEVPDYLEWKNYVNGYCEEHEYNLKLQDENAKLKETIKRTKANGNYPSRVSQYKARITTLCEENHKLKDLLKEWVKFYPIVLYEYEDTLKTKDIIELREKTVEVLK